MIRRLLVPLFLCLLLLPLLTRADTVSLTETGLCENSGKPGFPISNSTVASCMSAIQAASASQYWNLSDGVATKVNSSTYTFNWLFSHPGDGYTYRADSGSLSQITSTCPAGYTPDSGGTTCSRPDCPNGAARNPDGTCMTACQEVASLLNGTTAWYSVPVGSGQAMGSYCDSGCAVTLGVAGTGYYTDGKNNSFQRTKHYSGSSCTNEPNAPSQFAPDKPKPPVPEKKPPCAPGEGVMTSSSGTIGCVPEGTPNSNPPVVKKEKETKTNADGTAATTETTTTRDPSTGVEQKSSTATTKDANGNTTGVTSSSGTTGTTTAGNPEKPGDSDFCQKNPGLDICKGNLNKEETQKEVRDELKKLTDPGSTSTDPLKNATHTTESENQLKAENDKFTDAAKGITDPTAASKSSWQQAMESGWFSAIPNSGCTPITGTVGGRQFTIDHCEKASQISDIMSYALWFMLVVGSFVMFTGGQVRTQ